MLFHGLDMWFLKSLNLNFRVTRGRSWKLKFRRDLDV